MKRKAEAIWSGDLKAGRGEISLESGAFKGPYTFAARFEQGRETNPEELLGAAHAACFSMALSASLAGAGHTPKSVKTTAVVNLEKGESGSSITGIHLVTRGDVPGVSNDEFKRMAEATKKGCIVSQALSAVPMTLEASLANSMAT